MNYNPLRKRILEEIDHPLVIADANLRVIYVNESFCRDFHVTHTEAEGQDLLSFKDPLFDIPTLNQQLQGIKAGNCLFENFYIKSNSSEKDSRVITLRAYPSGFEGNKNIVIMLSIENPAEGRELESLINLRGSQEFYTNVLANFPNPTIIVSPDTSIRYVNPAFEELTGFAFSELAGRKAPYPWWTPERIPQISADLKWSFQKGAQSLEELFRKKNGEQFWVDITSAPIKSGGALQCYVACWNDITQRKQAENNIGLFSAQIIQAQEAERQRLSGEVHDRAIQSLASLVLELDSLSRNKRRSKEEIIEHLQDVRLKADDIVNSLRSFCHRLHPGVIDEIGLIAAVEMLIEDINSDSNINTELDVVGEPRRLPRKSELALFRVVHEALQNIKEHSGATGAIVRIKFTPARIRLLIADNGKGFSVPAMLADYASQQKLGLMGMRLQAYFLGAELRVRSRLDRGTVISLEVLAPGSTPDQPAS